MAMRSHQDTGRSGPGTAGPEKGELTDLKNPTLAEPHGLSAENELRAETWFFKIIMRLDDDRDFSEVLNARKKQLERSLSTVSVISWAASQKSESQHLGARRIEGFVHDGSSNHIRLGCMKRVMPENP